MPDWTEWLGNVAKYAQKQYENIKSGINKLISSKVGDLLAKKMPYRAICRLEIGSETVINGKKQFKLKQGSQPGTGFLIGPKVVITAAHFLVQMKGNDTIKVTPGNAKKGMIEPFGHRMAVRYVYHSHHANKVNNDYGAIFLDIPFEKPPLDWLTTLAVPPADIDDTTTLLCAGYPASGEFMYANGILCDKKLGGHVDEKQECWRHRVQTEGGDSGAPVLIQDGEGKYAAIGIHQGTLSSVKGSKVEIKAAVRITDEMQARFEDWNNGQNLPSGSGPVDFN